jgi:hypothetical protein
MSINCEYCCGCVEAAETPTAGLAEVVENIGFAGLLRVHPPHGVRGECADDEPKPLIPTHAYALTADRLLAGDQQMKPPLLLPMDSWLMPRS